MSVHVLLTTELWRKIAENHDDVYDKDQAIHTSSGKGS